MPVLDGWQLTEEIQRQTLPLPVVGLTGSVSEADLARCRQVGMKEVLTKPVKMADLVQTVRRVVQTSMKLQRRRVLLVDDDDFNLAIVKDMLEETGWTCVTAQSGLEALELLAENTAGLVGAEGGGAAQGPRFAVVVTDMIMPGMDGCELATQIRALGENPLSPASPPVVGLTGTTQSSELQRCLDSGMSVVLAKPVDMNELNATLEKLITPARPASRTTSPRSNAPSSPSTRSAKSASISPLAHGQRGPNVPPLSLAAPGGVVGVFPSSPTAAAAGSTSTGGRPMDLRAAGGIAPMEVAEFELKKSSSLDFEVEQQFDLEEGMGSLAHVSLHGHGGSLNGNVLSMIGGGSGGGGAALAVPTPGPAVGGLNFFEDVSPRAGSAAGGASAVLVQARQAQQQPPPIPPQQQPPPIPQPPPPQVEVDWTTGLVDEPGSYTNATQLTNEEDDL